MRFICSQGRDYTGVYLEIVCDDYDISRDRFRSPRDRCTSGTDTLRVSWRILGPTVVERSNRPLPSVQFSGTNPETINYWSLIMSFCTTPTRGPNPHPVTPKMSFTTSYAGSSTQSESLLFPQPSSHLVRFCLITVSGSPFSVLQTRTLTFFPFTWTSYHTPHCFWFQSLHSSFVSVPEDVRSNSYNVS